MVGGGGIKTSSNEAYGKVKGGEGEEGYEMVDISPGDLPLYEVPSSLLHPPRQLLPSHPLPPTPAEEEAVYDVIHGDQ